MRLALAFVSLLTVLCSSGEARASDRVDWRWRRFQGWEYAATAAALAGGFYFRFGVDSPNGDWRGGILFDDAIHERTAIHALDTRRTVVNMTDALYYGSMGYRLVDSVVVPGVVWGNWDTAHQMAMIDLEAFGFVALVFFGQQALFGRERPYVSRCPDFRDESCDPASGERNRSFFAGHPMVAMTAAALTCTHHAHLPLYGGGPADTLACGLTLGAAAAVGYGRVVTEMHYASDLAVGFGVGAFAGWALPEILHYAHEEPELSPSGSQNDHALRAVVLPMVGEDRLGVGVGGVF
jgi:membrane-associated phospholipid phosphatase